MWHSNCESSFYRWEKWKSPSDKQSWVQNPSPPLLPPFQYHRPQSTMDSWWAVSIPWEGNTLPSSATLSLPKSRFSVGKSFQESSWAPVRGLGAEAWGSHRMQNNNVPRGTAASGGKGQPSPVCDAWEGRTQLTHAHKSSRPAHCAPIIYPEYPTRTLRESQPTSRALQAVMESLLCTTSRDMAQRDPRRVAALCQLSEREPGTTDTPSSAFLHLAYSLVVPTWQLTEGRNVLDRMVPLRVSQSLKIDYFKHPKLLGILATTWN